MCEQGEESITSIAWDSISINDGGFMRTLRVQLVILTFSELETNHASTNA